MLKQHYFPWVLAVNNWCSMCSKYGFYIIMSEGIIDLHHILFYLYKCHEQTCCHGSAWAYGMTADITCPEEAL